MANLCINKAAGTLQHYSESAKLLREPRFCVEFFDAQNKVWERENIEFSRASAIAIKKNLVVAYIDKSFADKYPKIYEHMANHIVFADLDELPSPAVSATKQKVSISSVQEVLVFRSLLPVSLQTKIFNRTISITDENIFLFGGEVTPPLENFAYPRQFSSKVLRIGFAESFIQEDVTIDLEEKANDLAVLTTPRAIFVCKKHKPTILHKFSLAGTLLSFKTLPPIRPSSANCERETKLFADGKLVIRLELEVKRECERDLMSALWMKFDENLNQVAVGSKELWLEENRLLTGNGEEGVLFRDEKGKIVQLTGEEKWLDKEEEEKEKEDQEKEDKRQSF